MLSPRMQVAWVFNAAGPTEVMSADRPNFADLDPERLGCLDIVSQAK